MDIRAGPVPTVSVIIPTYNRAILVGRAIKSVLDQTFPNLELIVVDDGSTDNTRGLIRSFHDPRIVYLRQEENTGCPAARNAGIKAAHGEYIAFLDDDDEWLPQKLERQLEAFRAPKGQRVGFVVCGATVVRDEEEIRDVVPQMAGWVFEDLLSLRGFWSIPALMVRRDCFQPGLLYDDSLPAVEDWDLVVRLSQHYQCRSVPESLVRYHLHPGERRSGELSRLVEARQILLQKYGSELAKRPRALARHHLRIAMAYYRMGDRKAMRSALVKAICSSPWHPRWYFLLLGSLRGFGDERKDHQDWIQ